MKKKIDRTWLLTALECRSQGSLLNGANMMDGKCSDECPYYYDYNGCDLEQILLDAKHELDLTMWHKHCYNCKHKSNPDGSDHWLPCQKMDTDAMWYCADWEPIHE